MSAITGIGVILAFSFVFLSLLLLIGTGAYSLRRKYQRFHRLPVWEKSLISIFVGAWIAFASVKNGGTNGVNQIDGETNTVTQVEGGINGWENVEGTNTVGQIGGEGTNGIPGGTRFCASGLGGVRPRGSAALPVVTDEDIAQGWRLVSVSSNVLMATTFTMPEGATVWGRRRTTSSAENYRVSRGQDGFSRRLAISLVAMRRGFSGVSGIQRASARG